MAQGNLNFAEAINNVVKAVSMNCHIFIGSVHKNYMFYHGNFIGCSLGVQLEVSQIS